MAAKPPTIPVETTSPSGSIESLSGEKLSLNVPQAPTTDFIAPGLTPIERPSITDDDIAGLCLKFFQYGAAEAQKSGFVGDRESFVRLNQIYADRYEGLLETDYKLRIKPQYKVRR